MAERCELQLTEPEAALGAHPEQSVVGTPLSVPSLPSVSDPLLLEPLLFEPLRAALVDAPVWEKQVLELALEWPELAPEEKWAAERLRLFLLTWDPFEWQPGRASAFATSTRRADGAGVALYVPLWQALRLAGGDVAGVPALLGRLARSVVAVASAHEGAITDGGYAEGVQSGELPGLLRAIPEPSDEAAPGVQVGVTEVGVTVVGDGWQPIQFDTLEDLAQDLFGPADLDRSPVTFSVAGEGRSGCPGCGGQVVEFPDGLKDTQDVICGPHRAEALQITTARLEAAKASNPPGWEALLDAGQRLGEPHLPNGLGPRLVAAALLSSPSAEELVAQADLVVGAAGLMEGLPDPQTALGGRLTPARSWLEALPAALAGAGLEGEAAQVSGAAQELLANPAASQLAAAAAAAAEEVEAKPQPYRRQVRVGRNAACPCGSGKKYKFCHGSDR